MREETFVNRFAGAWTDVEDDLSALDQLSSKASEDDPAVHTRFLDRYRRLCQHLALARYRGYSQPVVARPYHHPLTRHVANR